MRRCLVLSLLVPLAVSALAQERLAEKPDSRKTQKVERIRVEDASSRVDELRVGGETQTITVQPKNSPMPAYRVLPSGGQRVWNVLAF